MPDIFVSYRRDDSRWSAGRINDRLVSAFGAKRVFFDALTIEPGADFHQVIGESVGECRVLIAVIGPHWLSNLRARASSDGDFVCVEIAEALRRGVRIVPLLIDGAMLPTEDDLPAELKGLARRHALSVTHERCPSEIDRLVRFLQDFLGYDASGAAGACAEVGSSVVRSPGRPVGPLTEGRLFRDADFAPEMKVVPKGQFVMGAAAHQHAGDDDEGPQHEVAVGGLIAVGRYAVTVAEYEAFVRDSGYEPGQRIFTCEGGLWRERDGRSFRFPGFPQSPRHPVVGVSWADAEAYCAWLSAATGHRYRLLAEAEWEYCCRAGSALAFAWGPRAVRARANYDFGGGGSRGVHTWTGTVPVDAFNPNAWGLYQMHGNVWEWCEDAWHDSYEGAPRNSSVWEGGDQSLRVLRGGSWMSVPTLLRSAARNRERPATRMSTVGFRVAHTLAEA
ncbi:MAG: SUMF1/EgtB/PvdO family nonheme iron enzyme [Hyphomicrobiaceae bacterium]